MTDMLGIVMTKSQHFPLNRNMWAVLYLNLMKYNCRRSGEKLYFTIDVQEHNTEATSTACVIAIFIEAAT